MIPQPSITAWSARAPWPEPNQVEQDLILSRLMVEIANHELLGPELAMRGGTCLHKLHLPQPLRYSDDLDYVRRSRSPIKPYMAALREIATGAGLVEHHYAQAGEMVHMIFDAGPEPGDGRIRIKIETNIKEVEACYERTEKPYSVDTRWWEGEAGIGTFQLEELMGTKLRALYQRSRGRDLFDLWHVLTALDPDDGQIVGALRHYMGASVFGYRELAGNLAAKLADAEFRDDLTGLVATMPSGYEVTLAADVVMGRLARLLDGAPEGLEEIAGGRWRAGLEGR